LKTLYVTTSRNNRSAAEIAEFPLSGCLLTVEVEVAGLGENAYITDSL